MTTEREELERKQAALDGGGEVYHGGHANMLYKTYSQHPIGCHREIEHDGFKGTVIGHYQRKDGKVGVVMQQDGTNVVHVYGTKWLKGI